MPGRGAKLCRGCCGFHVSWTQFQCITIMIIIYLLGSIVQPLNNWGLESRILLAPGYITDVLQPYISAKLPRSLNAALLKPLQNNLKTYGLPLEQELNVKETKPPIIVDQQCVVYGFQCDLCDARYVDYTHGHLHNRVKGHKQQSSAIAKHYKNI